MKSPKTFKVNSLHPSTLTVTIKLGMMLKARIRLAILLIRIAGWIIGSKVNVEEERNAMDFFKAIGK